MTEFDDIMMRIRKETGARTQVELAAMLGIRQSSISDAKRRGSVPADWQLKLLEGYGMNPLWLMTGQGARYLVPSEDKEQFVKPEPVEETTSAPTQTPAELVAELRRLLPGAEITIHWETAPSKNAE